MIAPPSMLSVVLPSGFAAWALKTGREDIVPESQRAQRPYSGIRVIRQEVRVYVERDFCSREGFFREMRRPLELFGRSELGLVPMLF